MFSSRDLHVYRLSSSKFNISLQILWTQIILWKLNFLDQWDKYSLQSQSFYQITHFFGSHQSSILFTLILKVIEWTNLFHYFSWTTGGANCLLSRFYSRETWSIVFWIQIYSTSIFVKVTVCTYVIPLSPFHARTAGQISAKFCTDLTTNSGKVLNTSMTPPTLPLDPGVPQILKPKWVTGPYHSLRRPKRRPWTFFF